MHLIYVAKQTHAECPWLSVLEERQGWVWLWAFITYKHAWHMFAITATTTTTNITTPRPPLKPKTKIASQAQKYRQFGKRRPTTLKIPSSKQIKPFSQLPSRIYFKLILIAPIQKNSVILRGLKFVRNPVYHRWKNTVKIYGNGVQTKVFQNSVTISR